MLLAPAGCHAHYLRPRARSASRRRRPARLGAQAHGYSTVVDHGQDSSPQACGGATMSSGVRSGNVRTRHVSDLAPIALEESDVRLALPARPENVAVIRHVLGAFAEAFDLPAE